MEKSKSQTYANTILLLLLIAISSGVLARAQGVRRIQLPRGQTTTVVKGTLKGTADATYLLRATKGQTLVAHLTVAKGGEASLQISGPGGIRLSNANGTDAGNDFSVTLLRTGDYRIVVFPPDTASRSD